MGGNNGTWSILSLCVINNVLAACTIVNCNVELRISCKIFPIWVRSSQLLLGQLKHICRHAANDKSWPSLSLISLVCGSPSHIDNVICLPARPLVSALHLHSSHCPHSHSSLSPSVIRKETISPSYLSILSTKLVIADHKILVKAKVTVAVAPTPWIVSNPCDA